MKLKIITINVWRYYEWENRKQKLIDFLKKENIDIVLFQEAASSKKSNWENQIEEINEKASYEFSAFEKLVKMTKWHEKPIDYEMYYGFGILSKYKIKKTELIKLKHVIKDKDFGFMHISIEIEGEDIDLLSVHFENTDEGSKQQLKETLEWCNKNKISSIIAGDFNMKDVKTLKEITGEDYEISYFIKPYFSFMPTEFSNNKEPITLDYIIAKKSKFKIADVKCIEDSPSDHRPIICIIELK
ncbi:Endonuclease/Exonuclease/phosphatase family protein [uncultured archaeon]|nr:Endonuclease/Exonuclease/phosphatase family protein [uncultured archaeon]